MDNKDDNLREMERIYEEQQREYANDERRGSNLGSLDHKVAMGAKLFRTGLLLVVAFLLLKQVYGKMGGLFGLRNTNGDDTTTNTPTTIDSSSSNYSIKLTGPGDTMKIGESFELVVEFTPTNVSDHTIEYISSDPDVISVDSNGKINAKKKGIATIVAVAKNRKQTQVIIKVID